MNPEIFAEWLRRQGHRIYKTESSYWFNQGPRALQAFPYHWISSPSQAEINDLLQSSRSITLRYSTPVASPEGKISYQVVFDEDDFSLPLFARKVRHTIDVGLAHCECQPIPLSMMIEQGWLCRMETLRRQGRTGAETKAWWKNMCSTTEGLPGFEMWGAVRNNELLSSILVFNDGETANIIFQQSLTDHLRFGVNNVLAYSYVNHTLQNKKAAKIFYGLHSLDAPPSVDVFKFRMRFKANPIRQRVAFHPNLSWLVNDLSYRGIHAIRSKITGRNTIAKAEGMLRFYLEGRKPLEAQNWPEALLDQKNDILRKCD